MKTAQVLISCMNQDFGIIKRSNLSHDVLVINQCDVKKENIREYPNNIVWIDTPTRGLSRSRNIALSKATNEICLITDDDEFLEPGIQEKVADVFFKHPDAGIVVLRGANYGYNSRKGFHKMSYKELFHINSKSIAIRRKEVFEKNILFDVNIGSGTGNGASEEFKFVLDCKRKGVKIYYCPLVKSTVDLKSKSQWFNGYNEKYFYNQGATNRYILGFVLSVAYAVYWVFSHRYKYKEHISLLNALKNNLRGIIDNPIKRNI